MSVIGDVVWLRSGGPPLTVTAVQEDKQIVVSWTSGGAICSTALPDAALSSTDPTPALQAASQKLRDALAEAEPAQGQVIG